MSRRQVMRARTADGRIKRQQRSELLSPTAVRRLVDLAAEDTRHQALGSMLGRIYLSGRISASEFASGKRWAEIVANYSMACRSPRPPKTVSFDTPGGTPIDPDSERGRREVTQHEKITAIWLDGRNALRLAGRDAERVVGDVCERGLLPAGFAEFCALRAGLEALSNLWTIRRKANAR